MTDAAASGTGRSPWVYVGCGCGCLLLLFLAGTAGVGVVGYRTARGIKDALEDPVKRDVATRNILGYDAMPEGYVSFLGLDVPFLFRVGMLANTTPDEHGKIEEGAFERAFFYVRPADWLKWDDDLKEIFEGRGDPLRAFENWDQSDIRLRLREQLGEGSVSVAGRDIRYGAARGRISVEHAEFEGILAVFIVKCDASRDGLGGWLLPDPDPDTPADGLDLAGTPADPEALRAFLSRFDLCR